VQFYEDDVEGGGVESLQSVVEEVVKLLQSVVATMCRKLVN
jgi:hypothetical protein